MVGLTRKGIDAVYDRFVYSEKELQNALFDIVRSGDIRSPRKITVAASFDLTQTIIIKDNLPSITIDGNGCRLYPTHNDPVFTLDNAYDVTLQHVHVAKDNTETASAECEVFIAGTSRLLFVSNCLAVCKTIIEGTHSSAALVGNFFSASSQYPMLKGTCTGVMFSANRGNFSLEDGWVRDFGVYDGLDYFDLVEDFSSGRLTGPFDLGWTSVATGGSAAAVQVAGRMGVLQETVSGVQQRAHRYALGGTGTTASAMFLSAGLTYICECEFMLAQKPTAAQDYTFQVGIGNSISAVVNQVYVDVRFSSSANNITFRCANAGVTTILDSLVDINPNTWHKAKFVIVGTSYVDCYIADVYVGRISTDLPVGSVGPIMNFVSGAGAGNKVATKDRVKYRVVRARV